MDWSKANPWTLETVRPQLDGRGMRREYIGYAMRHFIDGDEHPVFWGYFPAFDWVAFVGLFGGLEELPFHFPQLCLDIKQWAIELGDPELPHQKEPPPRARRRPLDERGLGVPGEPPSPRSSAAAQLDTKTPASSARERLTLPPCRRRTRSKQPASACSTAARIRNLRNCLRQAEFYAIPYPAWPIVQGAALPGGDRGVGKDGSNAT